MLHPHLTQSRCTRAAEGKFNDGLDERRALLAAEIAGLNTEAAADDCAYAASIIDGYRDLESALWFDAYPDRMVAARVWRLIKAYAEAFGEPTHDGVAPAQSARAA